MYSSFPRLIRKWDFRGFDLIGSFKKLSSCKLMRPKDMKVLRPEAYSFLPQLKKQPGQSSWFGGVYMKLWLGHLLAMRNTAFCVLRQVRFGAAFFFAYILTVFILAYKNAEGNRRGVPIWVVGVQFECQVRNELRIKVVLVFIIELFYKQWYIF